MDIFFHNLQGIRPLSYRIVEFQLFSLLYILLGFGSLYCFSLRFFVHSSLGCPLLKGEVYTAYHTYQSIFSLWILTGKHQKENGIHIFFSDEGTNIPLFIYRILSHRYWILCILCETYSIGIYALMVIRCSRKVSAVESSREAIGSSSSNN